MTIIETFVKLRDDIKEWVKNNLTELSNRKCDVDHSHSFEELSNVPDSAFIVTATKTDSGYTMDKTMAEIEAAYQAKRPIFCDYTSYTYAFMGKNRLPLYKRANSTKWEFAGIVNGTLTSLYVVLQSSSVSESVAFLADSDLVTTSTSGLMSSTDKEKLDKMNLTWQSY